MAKKKKKGLPEINAASMADIAFLLLIFFLLVTTIDTDKGLQRKLPPIPEGPPPPVEINDRNVFIILVNAQDNLLVEGDPMEVSELREATKEFIMNPMGLSNLAEAPTEAVVSLKNDRGTSYDMYIQVQNELTAAYNELRNEAALERYGKRFDELTRDEAEVIGDLIPMKVSEAEPEEIGGGS